MKDIFFTIDGSDGKVIEMNYLVQSRKLFIWLDKEHEEPKVIDIDYENMAKTKETFCQVFDGSGKDGYVISAWTKFSDLINPCVYEYYKIQKGNGDGLTDEYAKALNKASRGIPKSEEDEL